MRAIRLRTTWHAMMVNGFDVSHLRALHHRTNRGPLEQFDVLREGDHAWLKRAQWYAILTGVYWFVAVLGVLAYLVVPRALRDRESRIAEQTSSRAYLGALEELDPVTTRLEILFAIGFQALLFVALDLTLAGWAACYAAFALHWSSLQYADHAFSPLDPREGAWNLRVGPVTQALFLNYHLHLAHHQNPRAPWTALPRLVDPAAPRPSFWRVCFAMWAGPRRAGAPLPRVTEPGLFALPRGDDAGRVWAMAVGFGVFFTLVYGAASAISGAVPWRVAVDRWRARRVLRTGFCLLQRLDDLLDGDRPCEREPLDAVDEAIRVIEGAPSEGRARFGLDHRDARERLRLARAFAEDLRAAGGEAAIHDPTRLLRVMQRDRRRILERARLDGVALRAHLRETFTLSIDLMLVAGGAEVRAADVPALIDAFAWCSVMRGLEEDLDAGLINVPREVLDAAGVVRADFATVIEAPAVRSWMRAERARAERRLDEADRQLAALGSRRGVAVLRMFARSIRGFHRRRLPARHRFLRGAPSATPSPRAA